MVTTRRSQTNSSQVSSQTSAPSKAGSKRKTSSAAGPASKSRKQDGEKNQKSLEETLNGANEPSDAEMKDATLATEQDSNNSGGTINDPSYHRDGGHPNDKDLDGKKDYKEEVKSEPHGHSQAEQQKKLKFDRLDSGHHSGEDHGSAHKQDNANSESDAVHKESDRKEEVPSSILEKGLIYFFTRARVNIDDPSSAADLARSYVVLRPFPHGAALGEGPSKSPKNNNRVLAVPKKVFPKSPQDRFMVFVEHAGMSTADIEKNVLKSSEYATQTVGSRQTPSATPVGEGVYALTETGEGRKETHLAYLLTLPSELGDVQKEMGLAERGSWVLSAKNPKQNGPAQAQLPKGPEYPQSVLDEFGTLRWTAARPSMLDYENAQFILIGTHDENLTKATKVQEQDREQGKEDPKEELEKLEAEDEIRVEKLSGNHAVFADLGLNHKEYADLKTTW